MRIFTRLYFLVMLLCSLAAALSAQSAANMTYSTTTTGSLVLDKNANTIDMSTGTTQIFGPDSDVTAHAAVIPIGFNFVFMSTSYSTFGVNPDGQLRFGALTTGHTSTATLNTPILALNNIDSKTGVGTGKVHYKLHGTAPNRVLVIEWFDILINWNAAGTTLSTFQLRLYEADGTFEYVYGGMWNSSTSALTGSIGHSYSNTAGSIGQILTINTTPTHNTANTSYTTTSFPASSAMVNLNSAANGSRRTFSWTPLSNVAPADPVTLSFTSVGSTTTTVNVIDNSTTETYFRVTRATDAAFTQNVVTTTVVSTSTATTGTSYSIPQTGLNLNTLYYYRVQSGNEGSVPLTGISSTQSTTGPQTFVSATTGDWNVGTTWVGGVAPAAVDHAVISTGHTVTINAASLAITDLTVDGTLQYGTTPTSFTASGNISVSATGVFNVFFAPSTGKTLIARGNITNSGTIDLSKTSSVLQLTGTTPQTVSGAGTFTTSTIAGLTFNNTSTTFPSITWGVNGIMVSGTTTFTAGRVAITGNWLSCGTATATGTLTYTAGGIVSGTFGRGQAAASTGSAITAGADPTTTTTRYPFINSNGQNRSAWFERTTPTGAGILGVTYTEAAGFTNATIVDATPAYTVEQRTNENWSASILAGTLACASIEFAVVAPNIFGPTPINYPRLVRAATAIGTNQAGLAATPSAQRNFTGGTALADLTGGALYLGLSNADLPNTSIAAGNWNSAATWSKGNVPTCADNVYIIHAVTINSAGLVAKGVNIGPGGVLTMTSGDLTVDACTPRADAIFAIGAGTFDMQGGTLNVRGTFRRLETNTGQYIQSGGDIIVDGNNGVVAESWNSHITDFYIGAANHMQLTGGKLTVVDPARGTTNTLCAFKVFPTVAGFGSGPGWQLQLGNGTVTNDGGHANGYIIQLNNTGSWMFGGEVIINTGTGGTNRIVTTSGNIPMKDLTVTSGDYRLYSAHFVKGNIATTATGTITSSNTTPSQFVLTLSDWNGTTATEGSRAQVISGPAASYRNLITSPTASFGSITVNNAGGVSILTTGGDFSLSGTLTMTKGIITTVAASPFRLGTTTATATLSGTPASDTHIDGPFRRTFGTVTASNTFANAQLFPLGKSGSYLPLWISPTNSGGGTIFNAEAFASNSGTPGPGVSNLSGNTWQVTIPTVATLTAIHTQMGDATIQTTGQILQASSASGAYGGTATGTLYTAGTPNTLKTNPNGAPLLYPSQWTGFLAHGDLTPCVAPTAQPTSLVISQVGSTSLQVNYSAASPVADGYLVVRYPTASPTITNPVNATSYALNATLGAGTVVAVGPQLQVIQTGLTASTTYTYVVYSYNSIGCGGGPIYLTTTPLQGSATTCATLVAAPTGFGATARTLTTMTYVWTGAASSYELDVATDAAYTNFVSGYNAKVVTTSPEVITGLNPGTTYFLRIRATDGTCWSANTTAQNGTLCSATPTPYVENLNGSLTCLSVINASGGNNWSLGAAPTTPSGMTGNTARITSSTTLATNAYFVPTAVNLTSGTSYDFKLSYGNSSATGSLNLEVLYNAAGPDGAIVTAGATQLVNLPLVNNTVSAQATVSFIPPTTGAYYILLRANNGTVTTTSTLHIDDILVDVTPPCAASSAPTITSSVSGTACGNTNTTILNASGYSVGLGMSYQWQKSPDNMTWTNMGSVINSPSQPNAPFTSDVFSAGNNYFRLQATCVNGPITTNSNVIGPINYSNAQLLTTTPGSRCGQGTVTLGATANPGDAIRWYAAPTGGGSLGTGTSFTTPVISSTTNFHAAALTPQPGSNVTQGAGATTSATYSNPFYSLWSNLHTQHLITAAELSASGLFAGAINSVALNITNAGTLPMIDLSVKIGHSATTSLTAFDNNAGFSTVYTNASLLPTVGINTLTFSTPFVWDGTSNIILEFCHGNAASSATMSRTCLADNTSYNSTIKTHVSAQTSAATICSDVTSNLLTYTLRPQFIFNGVGACEGTRTPVTATVTSPPALTLSAPSSNLCQGTPSGLITVTSTVGDYDTYVWTPSAGVTGTAGSGYTFNPSATTNYTLTATQTSGALCQNTTSHSVTVRPVPTAVNASATPTTVCSPSGNSQLDVQVLGLPGTIKITEVTLFRTGTGATASYPAWLTGADLVEVTNISAGPVDISGWTLQDFATDATTATHPGFAFPSGTIIPANSVAVVCLGTGTNDVANRYYNTGGTSDSWSSGSVVGIVLKNGSAVVDAVGLNNVVFNAATGVTAADWTGSAPSLSGFAGTIRTAANDTNTGADWTQSNTPSPLQTQGTYNAGYTPGSSIASYAWSPTTFLSSSTIANPVVTNLNATTTYSVVVTTNEGCTATSGNVTVELVSGATITTQPPATQAACVSTSTSLNVVASGPSLTYQWRKDGSNLSNGGSISGATSPTLTITGLVAGDAGSYDVIVSAACGSPVTSNATALTVGTTIPTAAITPSPASICIGQSTASLTGSGAGVGGTYAWSPATGLSATNVANVTANPTVTTTYTLVVTNTDGCTDGETVTVTVNPLPAITATPATQTMNCGDVQAISVSEAVLASNYNFNASSGTYTAVTGGTDVDAIETDDAVSAAIPIGFNFVYEGTTYTNVYACSNGWLSFNSNAGTTSAADQRANVATPVATMLPFLAPLWDDLDGTATGGSTASYVVTGSAPNRVFTFEWLNWEWFWTSSTPTMSFQVKLYETTNKVEFVYRQESGTATGVSATAGIVTSSTNYKSLNNFTASPVASNSTFTTTLDTKPATGQIYAFERPNSTFVWSPVTDLYQDAAATVAYAGQNLTTVYTKPTASRTYTVTATSSAGCTGTATSTITAQNCESILTLTQTFIEGYMSGSTMVPVMLNSVNAGGTLPATAPYPAMPTSAQCDVITVALHNATAPYAQAYSAQVVLGVTGAATVAFPGGASGNSYYIVIKGRNIVETWSANPVAFTSTASYNFGSAGQAYGSNLGSVGGIPVIYSGDFGSPQDGVVDLVDYPLWENDYNNFISGYVPTDLNGDGVVDLVDYPIWENNYNNFISVQKP